MGEGLYNISMVVKNTYILISTLHMREKIPYYVIFRADAINSVGQRNLPNNESWTQKINWRNLPPPLKNVLLM
jgi:hypothetical protein